ARNTKVSEARLARAFLFAPLEALIPSAVRSGLTRLACEHHSGIEAMNISQLIKAFGQKRDDLDARLKEILKTAAEDDEGPRTLTDAEQDEYAAVEKELGSVKAHIKRLEKQLADEAETAVKPNADADRYSGQTVIVKARDELPKEEFKGQRFAQFCKARALS